MKLFLDTAARGDSDGRTLGRARRGSHEPHAFLVVKIPMSEEGLEAI